MWYDLLLRSNISFRVAGSAEQVYGALLAQLKDILVLLDESHRGKVGRVLNKKSNSPAKSGIKLMQLMVKPYRARLCLSIIFIADHVEDDPHPPQIESSVSPRHVIESCVLRSVFGLESFLAMTASTSMQSWRTQISLVLRIDENKLCQHLRQMDSESRFSFAVIGRLIWGLGPAVIESSRMLG
jgi:hypothetical protein